MTPADIITGVRVLVNDTDATGYRYSDASMLGWVNQAVYRTALLRPELFSSMESFGCTAGETIQTLPDTCLRLMEVLYVEGGNALHESTLETLSQTQPSWPSDTAGPAIMWARYARDARRFVIYPKAPVAQTLKVNFAKIPAPYTATSDTILGALDPYRTPLIDCMVGLAMSVDDEHINNGRAQLYFRMFAEGLGISGQSVPVTDTEGGRLSKEQAL